MSTTTNPTVAPSPFNQDSADIVLRTSDHVHYHVHSVILSQASPFFRDMFSLPQPGKTVPSKAPSSDDSEKPVVDISELSATLYTLLMIIYPVPKPLPASLSLIEAALVAAQKYDLELPMQALKNDLRASLPANNLLGRNSLHVWAIACRLRLEDVAQFAATYLAFFGFDELGDPGDAELRGVSAGDYFRLRRCCGDNFGFSRPTFKFVEPLKAASGTKNIPTLDGAAGRATDGAFYTVPYPDVLIRSSNGAEAPAHRCVLAMASPVLRDKLVQVSEVSTVVPAPNPRPLSIFGQSQSATSALPVLQIDEPKDILWPLLDICCYHHLCRPEQHAAPKPPSLIILARMMAAAEKYEITHALTELRARWNTLARSNPLNAYLAAAEAGQHALAKDTARLVLNQPSAICTQYSAELENAPAQAYHRLLVYYTKCHAAIKAELSLVKAQFPDGNLKPMAKEAKEERRWSLHSFLHNVGDSATNGADGIVSATRSLLPEYIKWRGTETSLSSEARQEAKNLQNLSQSLPIRLENAIKKVELKL
ncbi:hypothetical protein GSI_12625 [Ganoderma sinense ZZ0214-1]|uniref:BTB domain-containing protein n=1 Tax=Ganoderma sinense ZZ0214-1 TaxID=1077348 RepID=A0A2G8RTA3_9APHY|nr:hypothetical protein GSI_12625 [Ganoderma sinense ZZ0214-1]